MDKLSLQNERKKGKVEFLVDQGVNPNEMDKLGDTALMYAEDIGNFKVVDHLKSAIRVKKAVCSLHEAWIHVCEKAKKKEEEYEQKKRCNKDKYFIDMCSEKRPL